MQCASSSSGTVSFSVLEAADNLDTFNVELTSIDVELGKLKIDKVDFIKMDIEGAELKALEGASRILSSHPKIAIASYHVVDGQQTYIISEKMLTELGYKAKTSFPKHLTTYASV